MKVKLDTMAYYKLIMAFILMICLIVNLTLSDSNSDELRVININKASCEELTILPYIEDIKARAIVEYRKDHKFERPRDIMHVDGIGEKIFIEIRYLISVKDLTCEEEKVRLERYEKWRNDKE